MNNKIEIKGLEVSIGDKKILKSINLDFEIGKNYCLLGKNGSGKSTLSSVLMGNPKYNIDAGEIIINGKNLIKMSPEERTKEGLFLSFQNIPEIHGIKISEYLRTIYNIANPITTNINTLQGDISRNSTKGLSPFLFKRFIKKYLEELHINESFLDRDLNVGFSGGEKRKIEILQMKLIGPKYIILDEIDSGLDISAFKKVAELLKNIDNENNSIIIITHYFDILHYIDVDKFYLMKDGKIIKTGGNELVEDVKRNGFE